MEIKKKFWVVIEPDAGPPYFELRKSESELELNFEGDFSLYDDDVLALHEFLKAVFEDKSKACGPHSKCHDQPKEEEPQRCGGKCSCG